MRDAEIATSMTAILSGLPRRTMLLAALLAIVSAALCGCGQHDNVAASRTLSRIVPKATCGPSDHSETALQGQVPATLRRPGGFSGFICNLELVAQLRGEGAGWQSAFFVDGAGHTCAYYDTAPPTPNRSHPGVVVVDATDANNPSVAGYLASPAMLDPLESLKVNQRRGLLMAVNTLNEESGPKVDIFDINEDCRSPRLLSQNSAAGSPRPGAGAIARGSEGDFSPDGLTYYATDLRAGVIYPVDISDPRHPRVLAQWSMPSNQRTSGLAFSRDGNRAYFTLYGQGAASANADATDLTNGVVIADVSDVQSRKPEPQVRVVGAVVWGNGSGSHQVIPVTIGSKAFLIATDEGGSGDSNSAGWHAACGAGLPAWSMARIVDIGDDAHPKVISELKLEMNDPKNCNTILPDLVGLTGFTYGSHYCSIDDPANATTLACGYFESGVRVFDIRQPAQPREVAYYVPPAVTSPSPGSLNNATAARGRPDHCSAQARFDPKSATLMTTCQDNGFLVLRFAKGTWPPSP